MLTFVWCKKTTYLFPDCCTQPFETVFALKYGVPNHAICHTLFSFRVFSTPNSLAKCYRRSDLAILINSPNKAKLITTMRWTPTWRQTNQRESYSKRTHLTLKVFVSVNPRIWSAGHTGVQATLTSRNIILAQCTNWFADLRYSML